MVGGTYPQPDAYLRQSLLSDKVDEALQWLEAQTAEDYAWALGDFPAGPDEYHAFTHADRPQISASAALEADPPVSALPGEQAVILNETMGASDRAGATKRGRPATEPEEDGRAAQRRQVEVPQRMVLGATEWLGDEHIHAGYTRLAADLEEIDPTLAAQTSFVAPADGTIGLASPSRNAPATDEAMVGG
ncbi:hypothetical protein ACC754_36900, partial [Rhizobium johnstonii]|uniref:hypothetical protein n=1 Tax=Rhizobium johnstonii TaxID=3019933 RepID=UPI003F9A7EB0